MNLVIGYFGDKITCSGREENNLDICNKFGGTPDFILGNKDKEIKCKGCKRSMIFILQLNTQYSSNKKRIIYIFYCDFPDCDKIWTVFRSNIEIGQQKSVTSSSQELRTSSDDWLSCAGIKVNNNFCITPEKKNEHMAHSKGKTNCNNGYIINYFYDDSMIHNNDVSKKSLPEYPGMKENSTFLQATDEISSDSSENTNHEYSDPLLIDENLYVNDKNKYINHFIHEISKFPRQVIRYCFSGYPLLVKPLKNINLALCSICGSKKTFEFQIISTIIYEWRIAFGCCDFFLKDNSDWSTVLIFTCENDCNVELIEESILVQSI